MIEKLSAADVALIADFVVFFVARNRAPLFLPVHIVRRESQSSHHLLAVLVVGVARLPAIGAAVDAFTAGIKSLVQAYI